MDERTAELRDLFVETTGEEAVREEQTAARGSLSGDGAPVDERLDAIVDQMADRYAFASTLAPADLRRVARAFFDPNTAEAGSRSWSAEADAAVASALGADVDGDAVFRARMDLHLVADTDRSAPFDYDALRDLVTGKSEVDAGGEGGADEGDRDAALASALPGDPDPETVRRYRRVVEADLASRRVNHRYRDAFAELLTDADISTRLATDARRDGLEEATEDIETDVSL